MPLLSYYCLLYAVQNGLKIINEAKAAGQDTEQQKQFLMAQMTELENSKKALPADQTKAQQ